MTESRKSLSPVVRKTQYLYRLLELTKMMSDPKQFDECLKTAINEIVKLINADGGIIWFVDKQKSEKTEAAVFQEAARIGCAVQIRQVEPLLSEAALCHNTQETRIKDNETVVYLTGEHKEIGTLSLPLVNPYGCLGAIQLHFEHGLPTREPEEISLCENMASLLSMMIDESGALVKDAHSELMLSLENVTKAYPSPDGMNVVLDGISMEIYKNEFVVILGESGCGKTTLLNLIGGLDTVTSGTIKCEGYSYGSADEKELTEFRRKNIGFVFQDYHLMPNLNALENIQFIAQLGRQSLSAESALEKVGLTDRAALYPAQMSGGQQQRVAIARALSKRPMLFLADEPTAALDYNTSLEVLYAMEELVKRRETTVIMITHNPEIAKMADRVVRIQSGRIAGLSRNYYPLSAHELKW